MRTGMKLPELAEELKRIEAVKRDFIAPSNMLWVNEDLDLEIPTNGKTETFGINEVAHSQIAGKLNIPKRYYDRMREEAPDLLATNVNAWFRKEPKQRLVRTLDRNARAYLSDKYGILYDNAMLARACFPVLQEFPLMEYKSMQITDQRMYLQCVLPSIQGDIKVGEPVQAGAVISNSETGHGRFLVEQLLYVLSCANGNIRGHSIARTHIGRKIESDDLQSYYRKETIQADIKAFEMKIEDTVRNAFSEITFHEDLKLLQETTTRKIPSGNIDGSVKEVAKTFSLIDDEKNDVLSRLIEGGDLSQWGMAQAVTNIANDETHSYDRVIELERIGGKILDLNKSQWTAISN